MEEKNQFEESLLTLLTSVNFRKIPLFPNLGPWLRITDLGQ